MAKRLKIGNTILCEYVGMGSNNKHILVNVFSGDIIVATFPADIPIGLYIEVHRDSSARETFDFEIRINSKPFVKGEVEMAGENKLGVVSIPQVPLHLEGEANIEVVLTSAGYAKTVAISKRIYQGNVPGRLKPSA